MDRRGSESAVMMMAHKIMKTTNGKSRKKVSPLYLMAIIKGDPDERLETRLNPWKLETTPDKIDPAFRKECRSALAIREKSMGTAPGAPEKATIAQRRRRFRGPRLSPKDYFDHPMPVLAGPPDGIASPKGHQPAGRRVVRKKGRRKESV
jgi:hypothetical protein